MSAPGKPLSTSSSGQFTTALKERFYLLSQLYPSFEQVLIQAMLALATQEHILWYSKPGRAKSAVARAIFKMFPNAKTFSAQLTKDTMPDSLFGSIIVDQLMQHGRQVHNLEGGIADAVFAYLNEFFDGPDFLLRSLLDILNEREFTSKDMGTIVCPLHTAICTTNYVRQREVTEAVLDRILCKAVLLGVTNVSDSMRAGMTYLGMSGRGPAPAPLDYGDLLQLSEYVQRSEADGGVVISPGMRLMHVLLAQEFQRQRLAAALNRWHKQPENAAAAEEPALDELGVPEITPRTLVKGHDFSRAAAALDNRGSVQPVDQRALGYGLYTVGDGSGDDVLWSTLCDDYLAVPPRVLSSLEALGEIADTVGQIKAERPAVSTPTVYIGGQLVQATALELRMLVDKITRTRHPALTQAKASLTAEITALSEPVPDGLQLLRV